MRNLSAREEAARNQTPTAQERLEEALDRLPKRDPLPWIIAICMLVAAAVIWAFDAYLLIS